MYSPMRILGDTSNKDGITIIVTHVKRAIYSSKVNGTLPHGLSQQGAWVSFWTPKPLKRTPQDTQLFKCGISKNLNLKLIIEFFHLLLIPMFNDIMHYFEEFIHLYG